eukprot:1145617-Pelagomonas_calceolata.AAC.10
MTCTPCNPSTCSSSSRPVPQAVHWTSSSGSCFEAGGTRGSLPSFFCPSLRSCSAFLSTAGVGAAVGAGACSVGASTVAAAGAVDCESRGALGGGREGWDTLHCHEQLRDGLSWSSMGVVL